MFCTNCGKHAQDGARFCDDCGAPLQSPGAVSYQQANVAPSASDSTKPGARPRSPKPQDPYLAQIKQIKLQLKQLKLDLKQINTEMGNIRSQYNQTSAFVPGGLFRHLDKEMEDARLWEPQKKKQQLQQQIIQLEQQLLGLQLQQAQWQAQQG